MNPPITREQVERVLQTIPDPEFGLSVIDLGLVYDVQTNGRDVEVTMTLTSPSCPAGSMILEGAQAAVGAIEGVGNVHIALVWEPPWTPDRLSAFAREQLGWRDGSALG